MAIAAGATLLRYRLVARIGEGGMGVVWKAIDTALDRTVAIKVLPEAVGGEPERLARFAREARLLASLNHPHIAAIYSYESVESPAAAGARVNFLVMELAEGEDLSRRIDRGPIPAAEALSIGLQIADALESAHEKGIVHRDLKPANIKVTPAGQIKILDFGLAKALAPAADRPAADSSMSPTHTAPPTLPGIAVGTPAYMSPEQAKGLEADRRSDIWAFGVVLWEILTGRRLFERSSYSETLAAVLRDDIDETHLPGEAPPVARYLIRRCLDRDPRSRLRDIGEARVALGREFDGESTLWPATASLRPVEGGPRSPRRWLPWLSAALLAVLAAVIVLLWRLEPQPSPPLRQSSIDVPATARLNPTSGFALSPDGRQLAYVARDADGVIRVWIRSLVSGRTRSLAGTDGAFAPFWSPDSRHLAFFDGADNQLKRIPARGGAAQILATTEVEPKGGDWSADGRIVFTPGYRTGLFEVPAEGGEPRALTTRAPESGETSHRWPRFLPDGKSLLFLVQTAEAGADDDRSRLEILDSAGVRHEILEVNASAEFAPPAKLLFWRHGSIYAQDLDLNKWRLEAEPALLVDGVGLTINEWSTFSISAEETLVYHLATALPWRLEWRDRAGKLLTAATDEGDYDFPALSPDGSRVAYVAGNMTVWVLDLARGVRTRLTFAESDHYSPTWGPGGTWLAYSADSRHGATGTIVRRRSSGLGDEEILYTSDATIKDISWSPDGRWIAFEQSDDILLLDLETLQTRVRVATPGADFYPAFSPDGRWLAYVSDESGRYEIYVVPVADEPRRWQVSSRGGYDPVWNHAGDEILFLGLDLELQAAEVDAAGGEIAFGIPAPLFRAPDAPSGFSFDIGPDGRFLLRVQPSGDNVDSFKVVQNWPALLVNSRH